MKSILPVATQILLRSGLVPKRFVPDEGIKNMRDLTRYHKKAVQMMASEKNTIHKILQDANIKNSDKRIGCIRRYWTNNIRETGKWRKAYQLRFA